MNFTNDFPVSPPRPRYIQMYFTCHAEVASSLCQVFVSVDGTTELIVPSEEDTCTQSIF